MLAVLPGEVPDHLPDEVQRDCVDGDRLGTLQLDDEGRDLAGDQLSRQQQAYPNLLIERKWPSRSDLNLKSPRL